MKTKIHHLLILVIVFLFFAVHGVSAGPCSPTTSACGGGGCGDGEVRVCECMLCHINSPSSCAQNNWLCSCEGGGGSCGAPSCTPDCSAPLCGQDDGCGGTCSNTSDTWSAWSPSSWCGVVTQTRTNACIGSENRTSTCTECGPVVTRSACDNLTHTRSVTTSYDCQADVVVTEDCLGEIRGTLFDATNLSSCPSFDPSTGYLIGVDTTLTANNRSFDMADQSGVAPHPWPLVTTPQTDSSGNYSVRVYAPTTYSYDFSDLSDIYIVSTGPKLTCTSGVAVVADNPTNCATQPCTIVNNMSFGFERYWGGWWQVQGAGVHAEEGLRSNIPTALPTEQSLILPEPTAGNRRGVVSFGVASANMLGVNPSAQVSSSLWQALSSYRGVIYDYGYFNQEFKKYATTVWDGVSPLVYDDNGRGYQIFKVAGGVSNFNYSPTGVEKVIFLVNGNVTINSDITVPSGAFLAVISSGTITFNQPVTNADGWYLADSITIPCTDADSDTICDRSDVQFVGNGSFVAWETMTLSRDRGGDTNILGPSEKFNYRLDLYNSAPDPMKIYTKRYKPFVP